jgi:hypothetical protein
LREGFQEEADEAKAAKEGEEEMSLRSFIEGFWHKCDRDMWVIILVIGIVAVIMMLPPCEEMGWKCPTTVNMTTYDGRPLANPFSNVTLSNRTPTYGEGVFTGAWMMCMSPRPIQYIAPLLGIIGGLAMFVAGVAFAFEKPNKRRHKR